ncbi:hypothetical protein E0Z10_g1532 [Xylaria hypoxylon]|uniref:NACHT domain-containing protein n=1 Tax=Xylaria hypoxylon TaxID=37992 RepID=A0A4Z0ZCB9_9PEZI|nr:hypothetical protein E0Z10_g1532 [Xylaria hypoxylon]
MEALAVLGAVVNIAQALEYGFKLLQKSKNLRQLGVIDPDLNDDALQLNKIAVSLSSQVLPESHKDLRNLAVECAKVSGELISELEKLTPTNPKSKRQQVKAICKSELRRSHISQLRKRLNSYETQLSRHLASVDRIEFNGRLDRIGKDVHKITRELAAMQFVMKGMSDSPNIGQEISNTLQSLVQHYHDRFAQSSERAILDKLHFPNMHERFDTILDAHKETLRWLFDPAGGDCGPKEKAGKDFIAWLRQGSDFFHISGKPGAGKSTMMKYICSHQDLDNHLKVWCQGAQLACGQFFFWMPGTAEQKNLKGLLRGLLHSILVKNHDLIPIALPNLWELMITHSSSSRELEYRDFQEGFDNILKHASHSRLYKFVLFIDGLDEFEGRHLGLITTMKEWTEKYSSVLKICVSSREYMVFQQSFSPYPKLRLHEYTSTDIGRMVSTHLKSNPQYADLFTPDQSQTIVDLITTRAEGVFLWVSIVLTNIEDALISGASFRELEKRIKAYPTELEPLYWHLVHLTHETDRKWTFRALKMVQFFQSHHDDVDNGESWWLSLLELSFLEDMQYGGAASTVTSAKALTLEPETATQRLDNTYKKVYGRCKGLLHVRVQPNSPPTMAQQVVFIHRSIVEFLETSEFVKMARPYIHDFDCFDNACSALLQCIKYQWPVPDFFYEDIPDEDILGRNISIFWRRTIRNYTSLASRSGRVTSGIFLYHLEAFREAILTLSERLENEHLISKLTNRFFALTGLKVGLWEPLKQMQNNNSQLSLYPLSDRDILESYNLFYRFGMQQRWSHVTQDRFIAFMDCFVSRQFSLNLDSLKRGPKSLNRALKSLYSPWRVMILGFMANLFPQNWCPGVVIDWYLRHGADPDLIVGQFVPRGPRTLPWLNQKEEWQLFLVADFSFSSFASRFGNYEQLFIMNETAHLCQRIKKTGGELKIRDLLSYWFPDNEYFPNLIDGLQSGKSRERTNSTLLSSEVEEPPLQIVRRTWETDYIVYSRKDIDKALEGRGMKRVDLDEQLHLPTRDYLDDGSRFS